MFGGAGYPSLPEGWETLRYYSVKDGKRDKLERTCIVCPKCLEEAKKTPEWKTGEELKI